MNANVFFASEAARAILSASHGKIITVIFRKRTNGEIRKLNGRCGVKKYVKGVGLAYDRADYDLYGIYDMQIAATLPESDRAKAYRNVPLDAVVEFHVDGNVLRPE